MALLPPLAKGLVIYLSKHCDADGSLPLRAYPGHRHPLGAALRMRIGGRSQEIAVLDRSASIALETGNLRRENDTLVITEFVAWQRRTVETWRRLYVREELDFARLPAAARIVAALLATKTCDADGRIAMNPAELAQHLASAGTPTERANDRRVLQGALRELLADRYLVALPHGLMVRNFTLAQARKGDVIDAAPAVPQHDASTTPAVPQHDASTTPAVPQHDASGAPAAPQHDASENVTPRNHTVVTPPSTVSTPSTSIPPSSVVGTTPTPPAQEILKLVPPAPATTGRKKPKALPAYADPIPEPGTTARTLYDIVVGSTKLRPIVRAPGAFCLGLVQTYSHLPPHRLIQQMNSAHLYLLTATPKSDGNRFLRNQFAGLDERIRDEALRAPAPPPEGRPVDAPRIGHAIAR